MITPLSIINLNFRWVIMCFKFRNRVVGLYRGRGKGGAKCFQGAKTVSPPHCCASVSLLTIYTILCRYTALLLWAMFVLVSLFIFTSAAEPDPDQVGFGLFGHSENIFYRYIILSKIQFRLNYFLFHFWVSLDV